MSQVGKTGAGMQIAVTRTIEKSSLKTGSNTPTSSYSSFSRFGVTDVRTRIPELVPANYFRTGLTQDQFVTMLTQFGYTPDQFVDMVVSEMKRDPDTARDKVFLNLEKARRLWEDARKAKAEEERKAAKDAERAQKEAERKAGNSSKNGSKK